MSFDTLVPQSPINPQADSYGRRCLELSRAVAAERQVVFGVAYGPEEAQRLDLFLPAEMAAGAALPVLVFFHGGGFTHGYKEWCGFMAPALGDAILVSADYGLMPGAPYPEPFLDAVQALAWVRANIGAYGGDRSRIYVGGHSAGGAIAAALALRHEWLAAAGLPKDAVRGAVCISTSFNRLAISGTPGGSYELPPGPLPIDPEAPLAHVEAAACPFFIAWGGRERQRARIERSSMKMISALQDRDCPVEWHFAPGEDHFDTHLLFANADHGWSRALRRWIERDGR